MVEISPRLATAVSITVVAVGLLMFCGSFLFAQWSLLPNISAYYGLFYGGIAVIAVGSIVSVILRQRLRARMLAGAAAAGGFDARFPDAGVYGRMGGARALPQDRAAVDELMRQKATYEASLPQMRSDSVYGQPMSPGLGPRPYYGFAAEPVPYMAAPPAVPPSAAMSPAPVFSGTAPLPPVAVEPVPAIPYDSRHPRG